MKVKIVRRVAHRAIALAHVVGLVGCGSDSPLSGDVSAEHGEIQLELGSRGPLVKEVQDHLRSFGYFPNDELLADYPAWRPIAEVPSEEGLFDENTRVAVLQLQRNYGLRETGSIDSRLIDLVRTPRCGHPDNIIPVDDESKFHAGTKNTDSNMTWKLTNIAAAITSLAAGRAEVTAATQSWVNAGSALVFTQSSAASVDLTLSFADLGPNTVASYLANTIRFNTDFTWSVGASPSAFDFQSVVVHELGHFLGFEHSSISGATMYPQYGTNSTALRSLERDDKVAARVHYGTRESLPGTATDIATGASATWAIGTVAVPAGREIFFYDSNANQWIKDVGAAVRIAVAAGGIPWVVNDLGDIYRRQSSAIGTPGWTLMPGKATDIGASFGANGAIWRIGTTPAGANFNISKWNPSTSQWVPDASNGAAVRIAVDEAGIPWVVNAAGQIYKRNSADPTVNAGWSNESAADLAFDIGVADANYPAIISRDSVAGTYKVKVRNKQNALALGTPPVEARNEWLHVAGMGGVQAISVGPNLRIFSVGAGNLITWSYR